MTSVNICRPYENLHYCFLCHSAVDWGCNAHIYATFKVFSFVPVSFSVNPTYIFVTVSRNRCPVFPGQVFVGLPF